MKTRELLRTRWPPEPNATGYARAGAIVVGGIGAVVGLIIGLNVYAATAWFAVFELGIPAAIVGGLLGLVVGGIVAAARR